MPDETHQTLVVWHKDGLIGNDEKQGNVYRDGELANTKGDWEQIIITCPILALIRDSQPPEPFGRCAGCNMAEGHLPSCPEKPPHFTHELTKEEITDLRTYTENPERHLMVPSGGVRRLRDFVKTGRKSILGGLISWDSGYYITAKIFYGNCKKCGKEADVEEHLFYQ